MAAPFSVSSRIFPFVRYIIFFCVVLAVSFGFLQLYARIQQRSSLASLAHCFNQSTDRNYLPSCLEDTVQTLLKTHTTAQVMSYIVASTSPDIVVENCHPIGHIVGTYTFKYSGSIENALAECTSACRSACTHGVIGAGILDMTGEEISSDDIAHAGTAELEKVGKKYCDRSGQICHGIGHVAYLATQDDTEALKICDDIESNAIRRQACYDGVFMERAGSFLNLLFPGNPAPPAIRPGDYTYPCTSLPEQYRDACFVSLNAYQKPLFAMDGLTTPQQKFAKALAACQALGLKDRSDCITGIGVSSDLFGYAKLDPKSIQTLCDNLVTSSDRTACTIGVVARFLYGYEQDIYTYCSYIAEPNRKTVCYDTAFDWLATVHGSKEDAGALCEQSSQCIEYFDAYVKDGSIPDYRFGQFGIEQ